MKIDIRVKRKIVWNGREYGSVEELPEEVRRIIEKSEALPAEPGKGAAGASFQARIEVEGKTYASVEEMPSEVRRMYELAMSAAAGGTGKPATLSTSGMRAGIRIGGSDAEGTITPTAIPQGYEPVGPRSSALRWLWIAAGVLGLLAILWAIARAFGD